jgi:bisphosphoglycerate-dependent phosphoglycerate mutase
MSFEDMLDIKIPSNRPMVIEVEKEKSNRVACNYFMDNTAKEVFDIKKAKW